MRPDAFRNRWIQPSTRIGVLLAAIMWSQIAWGSCDYTNPQSHKASLYSYTSYFDSCSTVQHIFTYVPMINRWSTTGAPSDAWSPTHRIQYELSNGPQLTLDTWLNDVHNAGLIDLQTHGLQDRVALEYYLDYNAMYGHFSDYYNRPTWSGDFVAWGEVDSQYANGDPWHAYTVDLTQDGLNSLLSQDYPFDQHALVYLQHCYSADSWYNEWPPSGLFVGFSGTLMPCFCRSALYQILCCQIPSIPPLAQNAYPYCDIGGGVVFGVAGDDCWTMPKESGCSKITDLDAKPARSIDGGRAGDVMHGVRQGGVGVVPLFEEEPTRGADMLIYTRTDLATAFLDPVYAHYQNRVVDGQALNVRKASGDGSVQDIRAKLTTLLADNAYWNDWCEEPGHSCDRTYPTIPYLMLVGDINPAIVDTYEMNDNSGICTSYQCVSDGLIADMNDDNLEDAIVLRIPCATATELTRMMASIARYESSYAHQTVLLVGANNSDGNDSVARRLCDRYKAVFEETHHSTTTLVERLYGLNWDHAAEKEQAFVDAVNRGVGIIFGWDYETSWATWPGRFLTNPNFDIARLTREQSAVAILPGCLMGSEQLDDISQHDGYPTQVRKLLFGDAVGTTLACAITHTNESWDMFQDLWAQVLADAIEDAPAGRPWARIVRDAKVAFRAAYPDAFARGWWKGLAGVTVLGGLVSRPGDIPATGLDETVGATPDELRVSGSREDGYEIRFTMAHDGRVSLRVYDVGGRRIAALAENVPLGPGEQTYHWRPGRNGTADIARGVYFIGLEQESGEQRVQRLVVGN